MKSHFRHFVLHLASAALVSLGFLQFSFAGPVDTRALMEQESGVGSARIDAFLEREDVAKRLATLGVSQELIKERVAAMSDTEVAEFEARLDAGMAGGDAVGIIGAVFLVLLILELVGVTNVFTSI